MLHPLPKNVFSSRLEKISAPRWPRGASGPLSVRCLLEHDEVQGKAITQVPGHLKLIEHFVRCLVRLSISSAASRTKKIDDTVDLGQYR